MNKGGLLVPTMEIDAIKYDNQDLFEIDNALNEHFREKTIEIETIVLKTFKQREPRNQNDIDKFISGCKMGEYDILLRDSNVNS